MFVLGSAWTPLVHAFYWLQQSQLSGFSSSEHHSTNSPLKFDRYRSFERPHQSFVDGIHRQSGGNRLSRRALPRSRLLQLCSNFNSCSSFVRQFRFSGIHVLYLPSQGHGRRWQPQRLLQHRNRHHFGGRRHHSPNSPLELDRYCSFELPNQSVLDGVHRQRRCHRIPSRALRRRRMQQFRSNRRAHGHYFQ